MARRLRNLILTATLLGGCALGPDSAHDDDAAQEADTDVEKGLSSLNGFVPTNGVLPFNGFSTLNGMQVKNGLPVINGNVASNGNAALNGFHAWNGIKGINGVRVSNGFTVFNGANKFNALTAAGNLVSDLIQQDANNTAQYVVKCALGADQSAYGFPGQLGVCREYATESIANNSACQEKISACLMALTNYHGAHVQVELRSPIPSIGTEATNSGYTIQEGRFFGNFWGDAPQGYFCVKRKDAGSIWGDYMAVPRMCQYTDGTWNGDFWNGGVPKSNWMMDKCAYALVGICEDICTDWSCTFKGKTYTNPIEVWRYGGTNNYSTPKVNREFVMHYGGMPVVPARCADNMQYETHGFPEDGGYRSCADFTDHACSEMSDVWGQSAIQTWELGHKCPRACKMSETCAVVYEAEHAISQSGTLPYDDNRSWAGAYVGFNAGGSVSYPHVIAAKAGLYNISIRFNTNSGDRSSLDLYVNGERRTGTRLPKIRADQWSTYTVTQQLKEGQNTIMLKNTGSTALRVDAFRVYPTDYSSSTGTVVLAKTRMSGTNGTVSTYSFVVPASARGVNVAVYNEGYDATPDLDLFVRKDSEPSTDYQSTDYCKSPFGDEEGRPCSFSSVDRALGGTWYVKVKAFGNYGGGSGDGWELKATYY